MPMTHRCLQSHASAASRDELREETKLACMKDEENRSGDITHWLRITKGAEFPGAGASGLLVWKPETPGVVE